MVTMTVTEAVKRDIKGCGSLHAQNNDHEVAIEGGGG
jgi:hypothetical protein